MTIYRQGDVLLIKAKAIPAAAKPVPREQGRVILAHGEVTNHCHALHSAAVTFFRPDDMPTGSVGGWLEVRETAQLVHEEHSTITLPPGIYRLARQVEEMPDAVRQVAD